MSETHQIEYKQELTDSLEKEVVAFLNYKMGGKIIFGIDKEQKVVGLSNADADALKIKDRLKHKISSSILGLFDIQILKQKGKDIIQLIVASGPEKPYFITKYGLTPKGCFLRIGTAAEPMTQVLIDDLFASRTRNSLSKIKSEKQALTFSKLRIYYEEKGKPLNKQFANNLELLNEQRAYNYNGYLLSDMNVTSFKLAVFEGVDRSKLISTDEYGNTCIITAANKILDRLDAENKTLSSIKGDRKDMRLWNQEALREAVRNALVHNDYSRESFPKFEIFEDRIEITSAGGLPNGFSQAEFFSGYSAPRNKVLMRVFRDVGLAESLGIGIPKILETYNRDCFEFSEHFLRMQFPKLTGGKSIKDVKGFEQLTERQIELLKLIVDQPDITYKELAIQIGINQSAIGKQIKVLKEKHSIKRVGTRDPWDINFKDD